MSEASFHATVFLLGLLYALPACRKTGVHFACAAAYPLGLLLWVLLGIALLASPWPSSASLTAGGVALLLGVGLLGSGRALRAGALDRLRLAALTVWVGCFAVLALVFDRVNLAVLTVDSHVYVGIGRSLATFGDLAGIEGELTNRGVFLPLVQSASVFWGVPYLHAAMPLLAASCLACFVVLGRRGLLRLEGTCATRRARRRATLLLLLAAAAMASPYFMLVQAFYVHTNYPAATYLLLFCGTFWLAELEQEVAWLPFAFAFLVAFALQRLELPIVAVLFAVLAYGETSLPPRRMDAGFLAFVVVVGLWTGLLSAWSDEGTRLLRQGRAIAMVVLLASALPAARLLRGSVAGALRARFPDLVLAVLLAGIVVASVLEPTRMAASGSALLGHVLAPTWGFVWIVIPLLAIAAHRMPPIPLQRVFTHGGAATLLLILLAGSLRAGYHEEWTDSGNRMLTHVVPVLFFFVTVSLGRASLRDGTKLAARSQEGSS